MTDQPAARAKSPAASQPARKMTPEAALARHVEWLEFALAAARSEETWRAGRLEKATKRNRDRRATRLVEVRDEIEELSALLAAIRDLQRAARPAAAKPARGGTTGKAATRRPATRKPATRKPASSTPATRKPATRTASTGANARPATAATAKPATTRRPRKPTTPPAPPAAG